MKFSFAKFKISSMLVFKNHPSIRFCFIYLTHFISVMGLYCKTLKFIHYSHISSVSSKQSIEPNVIHFMWSIISHTDKILIHIVMKSFRFCPCWPLLSMSKVSPMSSILSQHMDSSDTYLTHTGVSSHIIQYAHFWKSSLGSRTYC